MKTKNLMLVILTILISNVISVGQTKYATLESMIERAIEVSPRIKQTEIQKEIAKTEIEIGTNLPDPVLTVGLANMPVNSFSFKQEPMTGKIIGLSQAFPFPGKLSATAEAKAIDTLLTEEKIENLKNAVASEVTSLYYEIYLTRKKIELTQKRKELLAKISNVVERKYTVGKASLQNLEQTKVEITKLDDAIISLRKLEEGLTSKLRVLLQLSNNEKIIISNSLPQEPTPINLEDAIKLAENSPVLRETNLGVKKYALLQEAKEYLNYPNFKVALQYSQRDYSQATGANWVDFFSVIFGVTIPLNYGGKNSSEIEKTKLLQKLYGEKYNSEYEKIKKQAAEFVAKLNSYAERAELLSSQLIPQTEKTLAASKADYENGKIDFANVMTAENQALKAETEFYEVQANYFKTLGQLKYLIGEFTRNNKIATE